MCGLLGAEGLLGLGGPKDARESADLGGLGYQEDSGRGANLIVEGSCLTLRRGSGAEEAERASSVSVWRAV